MSVIESLMPTEPLAQIAWVDCLRWAISSAEVIGAFQAEVGILAVRELSAALDSAGLGAGAATKFVKWFNANIWGEVDGRGMNGIEPMDEPKAVAKRGMAGGVARAAKLSPERRREIAIKAARVRWGKEPQ